MNTCQSIPQLSKLLLCSLFLFVLIGVVRKAARGFATVLFVVFVVLLNACTEPLNRNELNDVIRSLGFQPTMTPVSFLEPGMVSLFGADAVVCSIDSAGDFTLLSSETVSVAIAMASADTFELSAQLTEALNTTFGSTVVTNVTVTLDNTRVFELADNEAFDGASFSPSCQDAIKARQDRGQSLGIIRSVLVADVVFSLSFTEELSASVKAEATDHFSAMLGLESQTQGQYIVKGKGLVWGTKMDAHLLEGILKRIP